MDDRIRSVVAQDLGQAATVADVEVHDDAAIGDIVEAGRPGTGPDDGHRRVTGRQRLVDHVRPDEAGGTGDEQLHGRPLTRGPSSSGAQ